MPVVYKTIVDRILPTWQDPLPLHFDYSMTSAILIAFLVSAAGALENEGEEEGLPPVFGGGGGGDGLDPA
eukprot:273072-Amphidinium_carterae.1